MRVHPDCHVTLDGSYYSAPYRYVGQRLEAWILTRVVQLFAGTELVATHPRAHGRGGGERDRPTTHGEGGVSGAHPQYCRELARTIGPATLAVVEELLAERPLDRLRSVQAVLRLVETVGKTRLEAACARARHYVT
ncbi:MAG: hypothetical protein U0821_20850 [Chloroflexota bacterium]